MGSGPQQEYVAQGRPGPRPPRGGVEGSGPEVQRTDHLCCGTRVSTVMIAAFPTGQVFKRSGEFDNLVLDLQPARFR